VPRPNLAIKRKWERRHELCHHVLLVIWMSEPRARLEEIPSIASSRLGGKQTQAQTRDCTGMWNRADVNHKGVLDGKDLDKFRSVLNQQDLILCILHSCWAK
jgi:hypothetical protein